MLKRCLRLAVRQGKLLRVPWARVDVQTGAIRLDAGMSKNGEARTAFLGPDTARMLAEPRARVSALERELERIIPEVFPHLDKGPRRGQRIREFRKAWYRACRRAGHPGVLLHDLRRSGVRSLIRSGVPERVAMTISGHETRSVFDRYNIVSEADLKEVAIRPAQFGHTQRLVGLAASR
jgi:integrase